MKKDNKKYNMEYTKPNFFILFMAIILISYIIWNRLFRERLAKYLSVELLVDKKFIWLSLIIFSFLFFYYLRQYFGIKPKENGLIMRLFTYMYEIKFIKKTYYFLTTYILDSPKHLYQIIFERLNETKPPISTFLVEKILYLYPTRVYEYYKIIYFLFYVFPRMLVAVTIFIEIIFFRQMVIFYKLLLLLLLPLLYRVVIFILDHYVKDTIKGYHVFYKFTYDQEKSSVSFELTDLTDPDLLKYRESLDPYHITRNWFDSQLTYDKLYHIQLFHETYKSLINMFIYGLYTISFIFYIVILYGHI